MSVNEKMNVKPFGRVLYIEPNDVNGKVNGVPMTPDYTDMCISFNLICEVKSRLKNDVAVGETAVTAQDKKTKRPTAAIYQIFGVTGNGETKSWVSFLQGERYNDINTLTTYYTDINYDDYLKNNIVEGLGVDNITISHESYYTPTVSIKFIDHRGASLFGREEAVHFNDKITIDNIFGAFFTAPYPEYFLQIKGFYGKPITYRLACSGFKGSLNPDTGNFEAVATFIAYSYSLLTDIPFEYLVAAPYCEYFGKDYWEEHKTQEEWRMEGNYEGDETPTFFELIQRINAAFTKAELLEVISEEDKRVVEDSEVNKDMLLSIKSIFDLYVDTLKFRCNSYITDREKYKITEHNYDGDVVEGGIGYENEQILLMRNNNDDTDWSNLESMWERMSVAIDEHNKLYEDSAIDKSCLPPKLPFRQMSFTDYFAKTNNKVSLKLIREAKVEEIKKLKINGVEPSDEIANGIIETLNDSNAINKLYRYVYLVDLGTIHSVLENAINELKSNVEQVKNQKERNYLNLAINNLGLIPYIGNIFKLIMCHIETFVHMMQQCFINIENAKRVGQRSPAYLNVSIKNTDFITNNNDVFLPPWPAVNRKVDGNEAYSSVEHSTTYGWVGDFSPYFEEAKLVRSLYLACKRTSKDPTSAEDEAKPVKFLYAPIIPNDLNNNLNPFAGGGKTISSLAGMLGLRATQIFGIGESKKIDDDLAKLIGKIDALNYYRFIGNKIDLSDILSQHKDNLANTLYDIMLCKPSADNAGTVEEGSNKTSQEFERVNSGVFPKIIKGNRQPIYAEGNGDKLSYTYMYTKSFYGLVPANTRNWDSYSEKFPVNGTSDEPYFSYNLKNNGDKLIGDSFLHLCSATQLFTDYSNPDDKTKYLNTEMYAIVTNRPLMLGILNRHKEMSGGSVKVLGEKYNIDMKKMLDHYWIVSDDKKYWYYDKARCYFCKPYKDNGIEDNMLLINGPADTTDVRETLTKIQVKNLKFAKFTEDSLKIDKEEVDYNNLIIPGVVCYVDDGNYRSLFGVGMYYIQNQIQDEETRKRVKALLFLHTLRYNFTHTMLWDDNKITSAAIRRIPLGLAALYGGLLWRHKFIKDNNADPIQYSDSGGMAYKSAYVNGVEYALNSVDEGTWLQLYSSKSKLSYQNKVFSQSKSDTRYVFAHYPDYFVANELIRVFEEFLSKYWPTISQLELRKSDGNLFANGSEFAKHIKSLSDAYEKAITDANTLKKEQEAAEAESDTWEVVSATEDFVELKPKAEKKSEDEENKVDPVIKAKNDALKAAIATFSSFTKYYCFTWYYYKDDSSSLGLWLNTENTTIQNVLRSVYMDECLELRAKSSVFGVESNTTVGTFTDITVNQSNLKSYLSGFAEQMDGIINYTNNDIGTTEDEDVVEATKEFNRDTALPIYMYLKMLWDKWLVSIDMNDHEFMTKNFEENFVFIDSFYRNISHRFMINCQVLLDCYENNVRSNTDITVFKFIGDITTQHHCMFISVPDFITNWSHLEDTETRTSLETVFIPMSYTSMPPIQYNSRGGVRVNNKFVILYIPKLCETPSELNNFKEDGFNIWSYNDMMVINGDPTVKSNYNGLPTLLNDVHEVVLEAFEYGIDMTRYAYYVPAFGLAYGRQHNHIFKTINLNMETPAITSTVINTLSHISRIGANNTHRIAFIGQDIYPTYSNYSYICEFEMMGCAQIQPLMYFQLMNVPMWRGTYIIYSVTHIMTPGNMVTKVKAMKLSNRGVPYSNAWFTENPNFDPEALKKLECLDAILSGGFNLSINGTASVANNDCVETTTDSAGMDKWQKAVKDMAAWYVENVHGYSNKVGNNNGVCFGDCIRYHQHPTAGKVAADCLGFVAACFTLFGSTIGQKFYRGALVNDIEKYKQNKHIQGLMNEGFTVLKYKKSDLQPFDVLVRHKPTEHAEGHTEIYAGDGKSYTWGSIKDKKHGGLPCKGTFLTENGYQVIIRYTGGQQASSTQTNNCVENTNNVGATDNNLASVNTNGSTPLLIGDSWACGMEKYFKGDSKAIGGSCAAGSSNSAESQIKNALKTNPKPKFIIVHTGINCGEGNITSNGFEKIIKACNGNTVYFMSQQPNCWTRACKERNDIHSLKLIAKLNEHIKSVCSKYSNASYVDVKASGYDISNNNYADFGKCPNCNGNDLGNGLHPTGKAYKAMLSAVLNAIGQSSYLK